jgi:hypothetical protein
LLTQGDGPLTATAIRRKQEPGKVMIDPAGGTAPPSRTSVSDNPVTPAHAFTPFAKLNTFDGFARASLFKDLRVAKVRCKRTPAATDHSEEGRGFHRARLALSSPWPELLSVPPHDCSRRLQTDADAAALVDIGAFGGNAPDHILSGQYCCHRLPP